MECFFQACAEKREPGIFKRLEAAGEERGLGGGFLEFLEEFLLQGSRKGSMRIYKGFLGL